MCSWYFTGGVRKGDRIVTSGRHCCDWTDSGSLTSRSNSSRFTDDSLTTVVDSEYSCGLDSDCGSIDDVLQYERFNDPDNDYRGTVPSLPVQSSRGERGNYPSHYTMTHTSSPFTERNASDIAWANYQKAVERYNEPIASRLGHKGAHYDGRVMSRRDQRTISSMPHLDIPERTSPMLTNNVQNIMWNCNGGMQENVMEDVFRTSIVIMFKNPV